MAVFDVRLWLVAAFLLVLLLSAVFAQDSAQIRALNARISNEVNGSLACVTGFIQSQDELTEARKEIARLKEKYEPAPSESERK